MSTFKKLFEGELTEGVQYKKLMKIIKAMVKEGSLEKSQVDELYDIVVDEYEDMGDNPNDASQQDVFEIADASGL